MTTETETDDFPALKNEHLSWRKRPIMRDFYSLELLYDGQPIAHEMQKGLDSMMWDYPDDWEAWVCYWSAPAPAGECCRLCAYYDAQTHYRELARRLEADEAKKKRDPGRLDPVERHELERQALRAYKACYDLEDAGNAILEGRDPVPFPMDDEPPITPGQFALLAVEPEHEKARPRPAAVAPSPAAEPAPQLRLEL